MINIDHSKARYLFDGFIGEAIPEELAGSFRAFLAIENLYVSATREIATKLENLNDEFKTNMDRNPIHEIKTRVKTPRSTGPIWMILPGYGLSARILTIPE